MVRPLILIAVLLIAVSPVADAQPAGTVPRIGLLVNGSPSSSSAQVEAFQRGLRELGWIEGRNVTVEYRWADGRAERLPALAAELAKLKVDVIALSGVPGLRAARNATRTIPIVFVLLVDPVSTGFVPSFAHPGGNMTGLASEFEELITKQLQLLTEALPKVSRVALLYHPEIVPTIPLAAAAAARKLGLTARSFKIATEAEFEDVLKTAQRQGAEAIHVLPSPFFNAHRRRLIDLAARHRLPAIYEFAHYVEDGGLLSYGPSITEMHRGMARYVDRILKGAKPGELPIERPTTFELVINLKTAAALRLTIPRSLVGRADHVIE